MKSHVALVFVAGMVESLEVFSQLIFGDFLNSLKLISAHPRISGWFRRILRQSVTRLSHVITPNCSENLNFYCRTVSMIGNISPQRLRLLKKI